MDPADLPLPRRLVLNKTVKKLNNNGFTLIELVVSLLVSSFVVLAASFFLSASIRSYNATNQEISLQMESHIAHNMVEDLIVESTSCEYIPNYAYTSTGGDTGTCGLFKIGSTDGINTFLYLVIHDRDNNRLLLKKLPPISITEDDNYIDICGTLFNESEVNVFVGDAITAERYALLANHCSVFDVKPYTIHEDTDDLVRVSSEFELNGKVFKSSSNVSMRNGEHR